MMRIISGVRRGKKLLSLPGDSTRPTLERVKQAFFSAIQFDISGRTALDLFAGSGQLGLEALSRGASFCLFNDSSVEACEVIKKNIDGCGFTEISKLSCKTHIECVKMLETGVKRFSLVFLDPPYGCGLIGQSLSLLPPVLENGAIIICESAADDAFGHSGYSLLREYRYSEIKITILKYGENE